MAYQTGDTLAVVHMTNTDGLLANEFVNTFSFRRTTTPVEANFLAMVGAIDDFYNTPGTSGNPISEYIGEAVDRGATHQIDFYKIQVGSLGSPIWSEPWLGPAAPGTANSNLPTEVAAVLSFHADLTGVLEESGGTRPRARRRGRVFIGPLTTGGVVIADDSPLLSSAIRTSMAEAAVELMNSGDVTGNNWGVWSRSNVEVYPVVGGWTDNAPDTQRRRGPASSSRITWG